MEFEKICTRCRQKFEKPSYVTKEDWENRIFCTDCRKALKSEKQNKGTNSCGSVCNVSMKKNS